MKCDICRRKITKPITPIKIRFYNEPEPVEVSKVNVRGIDYNLCQTCLVSFLIARSDGYFEFVKEKANGSKSRR